LAEFWNFRPAALDSDPTSGLTVPVVDESERQWSIGGLAAAAGVTVRTLHHYDRVGLLTPKERSEGGHRRYSADDVQRLYRILTLRRLGFPLAEIASVIDADQGSLQHATRSQLECVERQLAAGERLREQLLRVQRALERPDGPSIEQLIDTMEAMTMTVRLTRIYTRRGDSGETHLGDMSRVSKTDPRADAYGDVDELNAQIGVALATPDLPDNYAVWLKRIQNDLFDIGAELSVPADSKRKSSRPPVSDSYVTWLEEICDEINATLEPLDSFVLPGGTPCAAQLHVCRTVCRRAERHVNRSGILGGGFYWVVIISNE
jgi:cob(I)alamin adenosyltransferase